MPLDASMLDVMVVVMPVMVMVPGRRQGRVGKAQHQGGRYEDFCHVDPYSLIRAGHATRDQNGRVVFHGMQTNGSGPTPARRPLARRGRSGV